MRELPRVYLAGPEVFFPASVRLDIDARKKSILADHELVGLAPFDNSLDLEAADNPAQLIYDTNLALMRRATGLIANLTPFRGPSADAGTIYELGYMIALGKPAAGFSVCGTPYNNRVCPDSDLCSVGATIEPFGLCDNLMLDCGLAGAGGAFIHGARAYPAEGFKPEDFFDEVVFVKAVRHLRTLLDG